MLNSFEIHNFKAFGSPQTLPVKPITVVFGPNSAGKSSLLHSFLFSQQNLIKGESDIQRLSVGGEEIDLGGFEQFVFCQEKNRPVSWAVGLSVLEDEFTELSKVGKRPDTLMLRVENRLGIGEDGESAFAINISVYVNNLWLVDIQDYRPGLKSSKQKHNRDHPWLKKTAASGTAGIAATSTLVNPMGVGLATALFAGLAAIPLLAPIVAATAIYGRQAFTSRDKYAGKTPADELLAGLVLKYCVDSVASQLAHTVYIGPLRSYPVRQSYFYTSGKTANDQHDDAWQAIAVDKDVRGSVNRWIGSDGPLQTPYRFEGEAAAISTTEGLIGLRLTDLRTGASVTPRDIGVGISQVMPILVHSFADQEKIILVEQPEVHLHPRLQAELADVFISGASRDKKNRFVLETHSEALILRLLRRIRETSVNKTSGLHTLSNKELALVYVEPTEGGAELVEIRVDEYGRLMDQVPNGFFEETTWEMF
jgi:hypothetical protein